MSKHTVLFTERRIQERVRELGVQISADYDGKEIVLVGLLKGACVFLVDLGRVIETIGRVDACRMEFLGVESYGEGRIPGDIRIDLDVRRSLRHQHVIVVDDVADTLRTFKTVVRHIKEKRPKSVRTCVLIEKPDKHKVRVKLDYVGFSRPNLGFIYGYGMDLEGRFRFLPFIATAPSSAS